jgi:hypothetical protein
MPALLPLGNRPWQVFWLQPISQIEVLVELEPPASTMLTPLPAESELKRGPTPVKRSGLTAVLP